MHREGGVYVDFDVECRKPLDDLLPGSNGFAAAEDDDAVGIAVLGAQAGDALLARVIAALPAACAANTSDVPRASGSWFFTQHLLGDDSWRLFWWDKFYPIHYSGRTVAEADKSLRDPSLGGFMATLNHASVRLPRMRDHLPALRQLALLVQPGGLLVEIGSFAGESTRVFLEAGLRVHAIDPWDNAARDRLHEGAVDFQPEHRWHFDMAEAERAFDALLPLFPDRLAKRKGYDWEFVDDYPAGSVDAVYIDSIHTRLETAAAIRRWRSKIKPGGVLAGHDFTKYFPGVVQAVEETLGKPQRVFADTSWLVRL